MVHNNDNGKTPNAQDSWYTVLQGGTVEKPSNTRCKCDWARCHLKREAVVQATERKTLPKSSRGCPSYREDGAPVVLEDICPTPWFARLRRHLRRCGCCHELSREVAECEGSEGERRRWRETLHRCWEEARQRVGAPRLAMNVLSLASSFRSDEKHESTMSGEAADDRDMISYVSSPLRPTDSQSFSLLKWKNKIF